VDIEKLPLEKEEVVVRGKRILIYRPARLEDIFQGDPFLQVEKFPFWFKLWEASFVLADYLASLEPPKKILELGAGLGMVSLSAAAVGHQVTATDYEELPLKLIQKSAEENGLELKVKFLDWTKPELEEEYDLVVGAEIVFKKSYFPVLFELFKKALLPEGEVVLAHSMERKRVLVPFLYEAEKHFKVLTSIRRIRGEEDTYEIVLNRLIPK